MDDKQLGVQVVYRNKDLDPVYSKTYTLQEYTDMLKTDLMRLITDVENLCYAVNDNKAKEEWSEDTFQAFLKIKHKLLDKAGEIKRIPENIVEIKTESLTSFVARVLNEGS